MGQAGEELMAQLKSFYDLMNELSMKTDKNLKNLKIPVKGPKGTSKRMRMKVSTYDAPGAGDIKKAVNSSTHSADKKPEKYIGTDGKTKIRMVPMDKEVLKKETLNKDDKPFVKKLVGKLRKGSNTHAKQADDLEKAMKTEASVLKPTKPTDITKHARTLAKNDDDYNRNKKKYIDKARSKVFRMYPKEATHKTDSFIGHSHAKKAGMKVVKHSSGVTGDTVTLSHPDPKKLQKYVDNHLGGGKIKEAVEYPHMMYDPKTGKEVKAKTPADHKKYAKMGYTHEKPKMDEALNVQQRMKRSRLMKRMKSRIAIGRKRAARKMANKKTLEKRSLRQARNELAKKLTRGIPKSELTFARKKEIEKRLEKPALQQRIKRLAKRKFKDVRKKEVQRKKG